MNFKRIITWALGVTIFSLGLYFLAQWQMKKAVVEFLERKVPNHIQYSFDQIDINLVNGDLKFGNTNVNSTGRQTSSCEIIIQTDEILVKGFSYWRFFSKNQIHARKIELVRPSLNFKTCPKDTTNISQANKPINLLKPISVDKIVFRKGKVEIADSSGDENLLKVETIDFSMKDVSTDATQIKEYIPFKFEDYDLSFSNVSGPSGEYEEFFIGNYSMDSTSIEILDFKFNTKYSKQELSEKIRYERDHLDLKIPSIRINRHNLDVVDETLFLNFDTIDVQEPKFDVYRDKELLENQTRRPLYAELIRRLPVKLRIAKVAIHEGYLAYEENAPNNARPGILTFEDLGVTVTNFSNMQENTDMVNIKINSAFMGSGMFTLDWKFNVFDQKDEFIVSGGLSNLETSNLNDFLIPNARLRAEGTIDQMYFTISGGEYTAQGDIKMNYEDFKLQLLDKERDHVKKIISFLGNLFINDGSRADEDGYRYGTIEVERNRNKSFFNYLWIGLEDGLIDVITGSGKKK
ncbi:DUF748 domain-containing protein [Maribacter cobaltidurans]|uniref:Uncharacterized protein n=1 Tax=Maribacter cobaltidurans TaxID=1178778 RepID=A0A223V622_9FLAO|nr:DUF748 domain-containing protein [Maribacter cobaltidurans]ASV30766.1 hypothetical protein CJ263_11360 [Maribacter cobaltidurans]GGD81559.1 hypothetical protein GCM10011412_19160 [Maribacter cobaltidurans]